MPRLPTGHRVPAGLQQLLQKRRTGQQLGPWDYMEMADPGGIMGAAGTIMAPKSLFPILQAFAQKYPRLYRVAKGMRHPIEVRKSADLLTSSRGLPSEALGTIHPEWTKVKFWGKSSRPHELVAHELVHDTIRRSPKIRNSFYKAWMEMSDSEADAIREFLMLEGYDLSGMSGPLILEELSSQIVDSPDYVKTAIGRYNLPRLSSFVDHIHKIFKK